MKPAEGCDTVQLYSAPDRPRHELNKLAAALTGGPGDKTVHQLFEEQAERTPGTVAVSFAQETLTYRELNGRANALAHHLRTLEVGPDVVVGVCLERSTDMVVSLLAILKAGGAYTPLDPSLPSERLAYLVRDAACEVVITQESLLSRLTPAPSDKNSPLMVTLELLPLAERLDENSPNRPSRVQPPNWTSPSQCSASVQKLPLSRPTGEGRGEGDRENPPSLAGPEHLAYVIYTSGTTGQPKGVEMPHRALVNLLRWQCSSSAMGHGSRTLQFASLGFDVSFQEIFSTLASGGTLVLIDDQTQKDPAALLATIRHRKINRLFLPFVMLEQLAQAARDQAALPGDLREVCVAGEQLRIGPAIRHFFARLPGCRLWNHYGPAEAHVVTSHELTGPPSAWPDLPPIGHPLPNCEIHLLDERREPVAPGQAGHLHIGGVCLSRGYLNRPELTVERFIPDPGDAGARLYRTGDLARRRPDGQLEFLGRQDSQVKIRGHRVELGEIEAVLGGHPEVSACAVVARGENGDRSLAAFVVSPATISSQSLRLWLKAKLPEHLIPSRFATLPALPMTPNGKVDRRTLEHLDGEELAAGTSHVAPRNESERELAEIWQSVLRRERVGVQDNFFDLGGHSLLAAVLCSQINVRLGREMPLRLIFEHPTIDGLARQLASLGCRKTSPIEKADRAKPLPMSFAQQGMWLLRPLLPDPAMYNEPVAWHLSGRVDRDKLRRVLRAILERHEILRTALVKQGEDLVQQVAAADEVPLPWQETDLGAVPSEQQNAVLEERLREEARRPFDLGKAPLWRPLWIRLGGEEQVIAFTFHHSIVDEWSLRLFLQEWERLWAADGRTESAGLPGLPVQYGDFAAWQRQRLDTASQESHRSYWREQLRDLPPALELPVDRARPLRMTGGGAVHEFRLTGPLVTGLRELAREEKTTLFTVMLAAYQVWLHRYTSQTDLVVATAASHRDRPETQQLLGLFLNLLPIRARLEGSRSFREILRELRETVLGAFAHADLPFEQMVELAVKERIGAEDPLCRVMFVLLEEDLPALRLDGAQSRRVPMGARTSKCDLLLSIQATDDDWLCHLEYSTDLFTSDGAGRMGRHLTELFRSITDNPREPIGRLDLMPAEERHRVLVEWNRTEREYPRDKCIPQLFEEQAERAPDAVAVVFEGKTLSYGKLNRRANHLARQLRRLGVGPQTLVGLRVERSFEMVIGVLAILKAGGAYWALEENLPEERFGRMLGEAQPRVLLAQRKSVKHLSGLAARAPLDSSTNTLPMVAIEDLLESPGEEANFETPPSQASDPAYVSYTSGSTGRPKGVVVPHRGVVRLVKGNDYAKLGANETLLHLSPLSFDASTFELWGALLNGGRVILLPPGLPTLAEIGETIRRQGVTTVFLTTALFHLMVDERLEDLRPLRQLLTGGEVLSPEHMRKAFRSLPGCRVIPCYGPTENTTFTTCHTLADERELIPSVPIGRPIANTQVYLLDEARQPVPAGVAGELYAGGDGLACGYLHQPQLTAERFIPNPFSSEPGARLYRTGDLARWRTDGQLEFLGRLDSQVKIRGFRIELGEIETVLRAQPEVREAAVIVRETPPNDKGLVAYLAARNGEQPDAPALRARLAKKLPDYMLPGAFVWLEKLPFTSHGKLDRKALPAPEIGGTRASGETSQPISIVELKLLRIWQQLFQREDIGRSDNFFALGGYSLLAVRLAAEIDNVFGYQIPIAALFQSPTIESLARRFTGELWAPRWNSLVALQPHGSKPPLFFIHGVGGDVYRFLNLVKLLPPDQPAYGVQAVGLDGKSARHITVEEMAAHYVKEILSFQPEGPVYLAGYSMGGLIAYEMAQQLQRTGRPVALLALLDTAPLGPVPRIFRGLALAGYVPGRCWHHLRQIRELPRRNLFQHLRGCLAGLGHWTSQNRFRPPAVTAAPAPNDNQSPEVPGFVDYYHAVASAYRLHRYPGPLEIFISDQDEPRWNTYWRYLAREGVSFHRIPGLHNEIFDPAYIPVLARLLTATLLDAQEKEMALGTR